VGGIQASTTLKDGSQVNATAGDQGTADLAVIQGTYTVKISGGGPDREIGNVQVKGGDTAEALDDRCIGPRQLVGRGAVAGDVCNRHAAQWVGGARVVLVASTGERREARTDAQGYFMMENVPEGDAHLRIEGVGPYVTERTVAVAARRVTWITTAETCQPLGPNDVCSDVDDDGYGEGADCIWTDCNDANAHIFEACLNPLPGNQDSIETPPVLLLPRIEVTPERLDFTGLVANRPPRTAQVTIRNLGTGPLVLGAPYFTTGGGSAQFLLNGLVRTLLPQEQLSISVVALASAPPGTYETVLRIPSNDDLRPNVEVPVTSVVGTPPGFLLQPTLCEKRVGLGRPAICEYSLLNTADTDLQVTVASMSASSDPGFTVENLGLPRTVGRGTAVTLRVIYTPMLAQTFEGVLQVVSNEGQTLSATARITGAGDPTAVVDVLSVAGVPVPAGSIPNMRPLDNVVLTSSRSSPPPGRSLVARQWRLISRPTESTVVLLTPTGPTTAFAFNSSGQTRRGMDVAGTYVVGLTVTDDNGTRSAEATLTLQAVPGSGLHVQLTWDHPTADMDLHLLRTSNNALGPVRSANDCHYANCRASGGVAILNWGTPEQSPRLDVDDTNGFGPENINVDEANPGVYEVGVHYFGSAGGEVVPCTVKIFLNSSLVGEYSRRLERTKDYWRVAQVVVPTGLVTEQDLVENLP
jgi:hypothetical protein